MVKKFQIEGLGVVELSESFLTGKKTVWVRGQKARELDKNTYEFEGATFKVQGSALKGIYLEYNNLQYILVKKPAWYEYVLAFIPFLFAVIWGNVPALCEIFPVVGGFLGGAIAGAMAVFQLSVMRQIKKPILKVLVSLALTALTVFILFITAVLILKLIAALI